MCTLVVHTAKEKIGHIRLVISLQIVIFLTFTQ